MMDFDDSYWQQDGAQTLLVRIPMAMSAGLSVNKSLDPRALRWTRARLLYLQKRGK